MRKPLSMSGFVILAFSWLALLGDRTSVRAEEAIAESTAIAAPRYLALISDLHMGLGTRSDGSWDPREDFRWPNALRGLLEEVAERGNHRVDLLIAGDFLELWQPPDNIACEDASADRGCSPDELAAITEIVLDAHRDALEALGSFASTSSGDNRVFIIPGNHDAALVLDEVWEKVRNAIKAPADRVLRVGSGIWVSDDGRVVVEHGHQIGSDPNAYSDWPSIKAVGSDGAEYVVRPWGERFVQKIFNDTERMYPLVDNLSPVSAGSKYLKQDLGFWRSAAATARFIAFNLFETSLGQKGAGLGSEPEPGEQIEWDVKRARDLGHKLFLHALDPEDPLRKVMEGSEGAAEVRQELDALAKDPTRLADADVELLCTQAALREQDPGCQPAELGAVYEAFFLPRAHVLRAHLQERRERFPKVRTFIYGHTHQLEPGWQLQLDENRKVAVYNTWCFPARCR